MNDEQREQVRTNAKYLQQVRPVDPDEICEYVEGQPHPAAVRQVLRESAPDLGFVERPDGSFEPAPTGPVDVSFEGVDALPSVHSEALEELLVEAYGAGWPDGESGDDLRRRIRDFKTSYLHGEAVDYEYETALGFAIYHLPAAYATAQYLLASLAADGLLSARLRVLDVGAGVGGPALGLVDLLPDDALVDYHAVEPSAAADVFEALTTDAGRNVHFEVHRTTAEAFEPEGPYDLVLCSNVLSELDQPAAVTGRYLDALADDGTLVAVAPADRNTATGLREIERGLEAEHGATVFAPTVRLWPGRRPASDTWSFDVKPDLAVPPFQRTLDEGTRAASDPDDQPGDGEFVNVDVQYAFSLLRTDGQTRVDFQPNAAREAPLARTEDHVTERIDCVAIKLSHDLSDPDANPLYLVGDGSQAIDHFAVSTAESSLNTALRTADYGDLLRFENVLVLWNDDEGAYNLVVNAETVVERIPA